LGKNVVCAKDLLNLFSKNSNISIKLQHRAPEHLLSMMDGVNHPCLADVNFLTLVVGFFQVFLMSLKAGGVALNLTVASHVFLMDPWWNPAVEQQAQDRIHRLGQYKPIK
jgi:hypothetical protein